MSSGPLNPYQPTAAAPALPPSERSPRADPEYPLSITQTAFRWGAVCSLSAIPSFLFGLAASGGQVAGMLTGILIFAVAYTIADYRTAQMPWRRNPITRRTLRIAYGTRITISILVPLGAYVDLLCGFLTVGLTESLVGSISSDRGSEFEMSYFSAVLATLIQGILLNLVLGAYALIIGAAQLLIRTLVR